jgi:DNA-binding response OmpR family regulator
MRGEPIVFLVDGCAPKDSSAAAESVVEASGLVLDVGRRRVPVAGAVVQLTAPEAALLEVLMRRHGRVIHVTELAAACGRPTGDSRSTGRLVRRLNRRLAVSPLLARLIEAVGPNGYRLNCPG